MSTSPVEAAIRFGQMADALGIPVDALMSSLLCSIPLPTYPLDFTGRRRWAGVNASAMWHPLLWLPDRVAKRYQMSEDPGDIESDDRWAVRVALELSASGMYDDVSGTWLDVLAVIGLDVNDATDQARVQSWLDGVPDALLDGFDVRPYFDDTQDADWALYAAEEVLGDLLDSALAFAATDLLDTCEDIVVEDHDGDVSASPARLMALVAMLGRASFASIEGESAWWSDMAEGIAAHTDPGTLVATCAPPVMERLTEIRDHYWPKMETHAAAGATTPAWQPEPSGIPAGNWHSNGAVAAPPPHASTPVPLQ